MWYTGLKVTQANFTNLSKHYFSLIAPLISESLSSTSLLKTSDENTIAFVDIEKGEIYVSEHILSGKHKFYGKLSFSRRLEVCGGVIVHEGAHIAFTPANWLEILLDSFIKNESNRTIANLVEDVAIESLASTRNKNFKILLSTLNTAVFSDEEIGLRSKKWGGEKPSSLDERTAAVNYAITWKRDTYPFVLRTDFEKALYDLLMRAKNADNIKIRAEITKAFIEMLWVDGVNDVDSEVGKPFFDVCGNEIKDDATLSSANVVLQKDGKFLLDSIELNTLSVFNLIPNTKPIVEEIKPLNFSTFLSIENGRSAQRKLRGAPTSSGIHIKNLAHFDEGKIFGGSIIDGGRVGMGKPDIIVLVDLSGSMLDKMYNGKSKIKFALEAVSGLAKSLSDGGFGFSIFGHATGWTPDDIDKLPHTTCGSLLTIIKLKDFSEKSLRSGKLETLYKNFGGGGNCDSAALLFCGSQFPDNNNKKIIIIVSDGAPSERSVNYLQKNWVNGVSDYGDAVSDTAKVVAHLRRKSINVFSLAIDKAAISPCEKIYGKDFSHHVEEVRQIVDAIIKYTV